MGWFAAFNGATFLLFALDKWRAVRIRRRVPENVLVMMGALGGWIGGWLGMELFRHKTAKFGFKLRYAAALIPFCAEVGFWWHFR
jgi:uncharacterized membrane protein YsdA (DUF1294 family)